MQGADESIWCWAEMEGYVVAGSHDDGSLRLADAVVPKDVFLLVHAVRGQAALSFSFSFSARQNVIFPQGTVHSSSRQQPIETSPCQGVMTAMQLVNRSCTPYTPVSWRVCTPVELQQQKPSLSSGPTIHGIHASLVPAE